ncbi:hypothetical protein K469DRAFT_696318 [Zopfia rhizophila CBS 207.26]|uniref:Nephrocystin 3-like N-terminal domain-containing protein n=1 Tax=Zopfia rhizophila CBS 207.26 TaxID=1314779 RepID=A0A6A6DK33_9PEZI|nr:hypothetical protein K469DRAFT_696318 [Zopfia rhizophila CBS 207.26]
MSQPNYLVRAFMFSVKHAKEQRFNWLSDHSSQHWKTEGGALWIRGKPGSGKLTLAKHILNYIDSWYCCEVSKDSYVHTAQGPLYAAWFYITGASAVAMSHQAMLQCLLLRLLSQDESLFQAYKDVYHTKRGSFPTAWQWSRESVTNVFRNVATLQGRDIICIIDALDESEDEFEVYRSRNHILDFLFRSYEPGLIPRSDSLPLAGQRSYSRIGFATVTKSFWKCENSDDVERIADSGLLSLQKALMQQDDPEAKSLVNL